MTMFISLKRLTSLLLIGIVSSSAYAQDVDDLGFVEAIPLHRAPPVYPRNELIDGNAGMAEIEFMIDEAGQVFAPRILRSTATKFESAALAAVKSYRYEPAMFNDKAVQSRTSISIQFIVEGEIEGVSKRFSSMYKRVLKELEADQPKLSKIDQSMSSMLAAGNLSSYALARYNLLELGVARAFGNLPQQMEAIRKLLMFDGRVSEKNRALDKGMLQRVRYSLFYSLVSTQRYAEALELHSTIKRKDQSVALQLSSTVAKIEQLRQGGGQSVIDIDLGVRGYSIEYLLNNSLGIVDVEGVITSLNLRCQRKFKQLSFAAGSEYQLPKSWGACLLEVVGEPGTVAKLVQY
ncbi:MAG: energy transducer TonB [Arenicella sp.]|nr:energy transducer TonB [Arenicella sp.]